MEDDIKEKEEGGNFVRMVFNKILIMDKKDVNIKINNIGINKSVYLYNLKGCTINITGKINNIYCENCDLVNIYFESTINAFDIYNSGRVYINCFDKLPILISENVKSLVIVFEKTPFETVFTIMSTYNVNCYSVKLKRYFGIKFSMFKDRFSTLFIDNPEDAVYKTAVYKLLPEVNLSNTNSITVF
jgi:hypothetical protein